MSYLEKIQRKIYKREEDDEVKQRLDTHDDYTPGEQPLPQSQEDTPSSSDYSPQYFMSHRIRRWLIIGLGSITAIGAVSFGIFLLFVETSFDESKVNISLVASGGIASGDTIQLQYLIQNDNPSDIKNVQLVLRYPKNSQITKPAPVSGVLQVIPINTLKGKESLNITAEAAVFGTDQEFLTIEGDLTYSAGPTGKNRFSKSANHGFFINGTPIKFGITCPRILTSGQLISCTLEYDNTSQESFENIRITAEYPTEFSLSSTTPDPILFNNTWVIPSLEANRRGNIRFDGKLAPFEGNPPVFKTQLEIQDPQGNYFVLLKDEYSGEELNAPLTLQQVAIFEEEPITKVELGQSLTWSIEYKNTTASDIRNVVIESFIDTSFFDASSIAPFSNGIYYPAESKIVWDNRRKADLNFLEAFKSGSTGFSARVRPDISQSRKDVIGSITSTITTPTAPVELAGLNVDFSDTSSLSLKGQLSVSGSYSRSNTPFQNFGPDPMQTGVDSSFTVSWELSALHADIEDITVTAHLPLEIRWSNLIFPIGEDIDHNPITGIVSWSVPKVPAGTGYQSLPRSVQFQVVANPGPGRLRIGSALGKVSAKGVEVFNNLNISSSSRHD